MAKRAVLFANGEMPQAGLILPFLREDDTFIAVDGGLRHLRNLYKTPAMLVGDMDSVSEHEAQSAAGLGIEVVRSPREKDENDLELALLAAVEKGFVEILVIAALGGRLDQTLSNLGLLMLPELAGLHATIETGVEEVFLIRDRAEIHGQPGDLVSLIPMQGEVTGVKTADLQFPLRNETLYPYKTRGVSNVMLTDCATVTIDSGYLLCIHTRKNGKEIP